MLEARDIRIARHGRYVLNGVSAVFASGKVNVIIGPNGAGKSTLLSCLAGLTAADGGAALLDGNDVTQIEPKLRGRRIGLLPQNGEVNWDVTVRDLVALGRFAHQNISSQTDDHMAVETAMTTTDCAQFAGRKIMSLSGGERARVLMARVLAGQPAWLLADEPLANLDPRYKLELLASLQRRALGGIGVVAVLHDLTLAARTADHVILMQDGGIFAAGSAADVMTAANLNAVFGLSCEILRDSTGRLVIVPN
jgi:ABC-type cobalamin/Fe3+-siderophores transport system ATPase subunit